MRFKTDENIHEEVAAFLREHQHDALTVWDQNLKGRPDSDIASVCRAENRALITLDMDFADVLTYPPAEYTGIIVIRLRLLSRRHTREAVERILPLLASEPLIGRLWIVDQLGARVRVHEE